MTYCNKEDRLQVEWLQQAIPLEEDAEDIQDVEVDWILGGWNGSWGESSQPACIPQGIDDSSLDSMEDIHLLKKRYQPRKFRRTTTNQQGRQVRKQYGNYSRQQSSWQAWNSQCLAVWCVPFWCARTSRVGDPLMDSIVITFPRKSFIWSPVRAQTAEFTNTKFLSFVLVGNSVFHIGWSEAWS